MTTNSEIITVALADDHVLLRNALASLINNFGDFKVIIQASNGNELIEAIRNGKIPKVAILDLNMPEKNGYDTAKWLKENYPEIEVLMLTMYDSDLALIRLLQVGVKGFLKKDIHPSELKFAIKSVAEEGYYYSHNATGKLVNLFRKGKESSAMQKAVLNEIELSFLKSCASEMTYKEIAQIMKLNPRAVDNLRDNLFTKLDVKSRVGLVMYAMKHGVATF
ncbi:MAG TPA: response regulator transcription factor [Flavitalea sp.]|nr:response regulator transcription factor [Flavitalea sp.]